MGKGSVLGMGIEEKMVYTYKAIGGGQISRKAGWGNKYRKRKESGAMTGVKKRHTDIQGT